MEPVSSKEPFSFWYTNWKGETRKRTVIVDSDQGLWYGTTEWHPESQLFMRAFDVDKGEIRDFAVADIIREPKN